MSLIVDAKWYTLNLLAPTPQNGQTRSNNSSAFADELLSFLTNFVGLALKGPNSANFDVAYLGDVFFQ